MAVPQGHWLVAALISGATVATTLVTTRVAAADEIDSRLANYELEVGRLSTDLPRPNQLSAAAGQRRLLDAEVAYSLGDYDRAAVMLFDLATKPGPDQEAASFYLGESLFQKGDRGGARAYYERVASSGNVASKYYQPSLERLIEVAITQRDEASAATQVAALDRISPGLRLPSVPYTRGKLAFSQRKYDEAIAYFQEVAKGSEYEMQAVYYTATTYVAKQDLQRATDIFTDLIARKPHTANDRRIIELSQLALGRLYYERDQPSKSIDAYLLVDRRSDLFPDALYEVGWVYVKNKQYDKALRALELLSQSDPQSTKTPTVRILEGNLRIRKAQMVRGLQIQGTLDNRSPENPATEYDKAVQVFTETHDIYVPSYAALAQIVDAKADPAQYLMQIAGRSGRVFQAAAPLPEAAVQYLRDEPEVQRVVAVEDDLGDITANLAATEATLARLHAVVAAGDRTSVYPALASRRARVGAIQDDLLRLRNQIADKELRLVAGSGELASLSAARKQRFDAYAAMPNPDQATTEQLSQREAGYLAIEAAVGEVDDAIGATQAMAVALRKYSADTADIPGDQKKTLAGSLDEAARESQAIENELDRVRSELQLARDLAAIGEGSSTAMRDARIQLKAAEDAEHQALAGLAGTSSDRGKSQAFAAQGDRAAALAGRLEQTDREIGALVDQGLQEVRGLLAETQATLDAYKAELAGYEGETRSIGSAVLGASFKDVKAKFYDIVIRSDVGNVDVAWSQKADTDDDLKRLNLSRQRELKQLKDEFKDILDGGLPKPSAPVKKLEPPRPEALPPSGSPDKGAVEPRVAPGTGKPGTPTAPSVRPDDKKPDPKKLDPKKPEPKKTEPRKTASAKGVAP